MRFCSSEALVRVILLKVHPLPPSFDPYLWYWKSPAEDSVADEERYALLLLTKLADRHEEMQIEASDRVHFAAAIGRAQRFLRQTLASRCPRSPSCCWLYNII